MSSITTFGAFMTARLGIYAAQKGLDVTGNNIANINTTGYTRQVLRQISLKTGGADRYQSIYDAAVGNGVLCTGVDQIRDAYLDIRYRDEQSSVGAMDSKLTGLDALSAILDEVGENDDKGVIENQFNDLISQLNTLSLHVGEEQYDTLVRSSASTLTQLLNSYATKLENLQKNQEDGFNQDLDEVNSILENIRDLNVSIRNSEIHGDSALEQKDQRNLLIDQLSKYMKIDVSYTSSSIGGGQSVDNLVIKLGGDAPTSTASTTLIDGIYGSQLSIKSGSTNYDLVVSQLTSAKGQALSGSVDVELGDNDLYGSLQAAREIMTEKGEYSTASEIAADPDAATKRGIPYYQMALDALANKFATVLNDANTVTDVSGNITMGGPLFSNNGNTDDTTGITAANISISTSWSTGAVSVLNSKDSAAASKDNTNIIHIKCLLESDQDYAPSDISSGASSTVYFSGSFQEMLSNINTTLANDKKTTSTMLDNYISSSDEIYTSRVSISGVGLNDEAANLMQYQKAYSAACRLMTTVDEALDKLINGTGAVGR